MLMSSAFPRNGMRRGPGGSGSLVDFFALDVQTDKKTTRETAPMTIAMVSIPDEDEDDLAAVCGCILYSFQRSNR